MPSVYVEVARERGYFPLAHDSLGTAECDMLIADSQGKNSAIGCLHEGMASGPTLDSVGCLYRRSAVGCVVFLEHDPS